MPVPVVFEAEGEQWIAVRQMRNADRWGRRLTEKCVVEVVPDGRGGEMITTHVSAIGNDDYGAAYLIRTREYPFPEDGSPVVTELGLGGIETSSRDWWTLDLVDADRFNPAPLERWLPDLNGMPNAVQVRQETYNPAGSLAYKTLVVHQYREDGTDRPPSWERPRELDRRIVNGQPEMPVHRVSLWRDRVRVEVLRDGRVVWEMERRIDPVGWRAVRPVWCHHSYTPEKGPGENGFGTGAAATRCWQYPDRGGIPLGDVHVSDLEHWTGVATRAEQSATFTMDHPATQPNVMRYVSNKTSGSGRRSPASGRSAGTTELAAWEEDIPVGTSVMVVTGRTDYWGADAGIPMVVRDVWCEAAVATGAPPHDHDDHDHEDPPPVEDPPHDHEEPPVTGAVLGDVTFDVDGQDVTVTVEVEGTGTVLVDVELYAAGEKVRQLVQDSVAAPSIEHVRFVNVPPGTYRLAVGLFKPGWTGLVQWLGAAGTVVVDELEPEPEPTDRYVEGFRDGWERAVSDLRGFADGLKLPDLGTP